MVTPRRALCREIVFFVFNFATHYRHRASVSAQGVSGRRRRAATLHTCRLARQLHRRPPRWRTASCDPHRPPSPSTLAPTSPRPSPCLALRCACPVRGGRQRRPPRPSRGTTALCSPRPPRSTPNPTGSRHLDTSFNAVCVSSRRKPLRRAEARLGVLSIKPGETASCRPHRPRSSTTGATLSTRIFAPSALLSVCRSRPCYEHQPRLWRFN